MPWTPEFWIYKKNFEMLRPALAEVEDVVAFRFNVAEKEGVVVGVEVESSSLHEKLHDALKEVPHWIINGESGYGPECCKEWGDSFEIDFAALMTGKSR